MMREPWFWRERTIAARAASYCLAPAALLYDAAQQIRTAATRPAEAPAPVICVGNATLGGVGKTPFAILIADRLKHLGVSPHFLTRGYRGSLRGPVLVDTAVHSANDVGDEALLLADAAPTWVARRRAAGAEAAARAGATTIVMDDGYQNPTLAKTLAILLVDAVDASGNGMVFPAGPLREPMDRAERRADVVVKVCRGPDDFAAREADSLRAWLEPSADIAPRRVAAFCGIGRPERFFAMLEARGFELAERHPFPDHHRFSATEIDVLRHLAKKANAALITTAKDFVRLAPESRDGVSVLPVFMQVSDPERIDAVLQAAIDRFAGKARA